MTKDTGSYQNELAGVLRHTASPMALLNQKIIVDCNAAFCQMVGADNATNQPIDNYIAGDYIHQLEWLMGDRRNHCDKTILHLTHEDPPRNVLAQFWRLDESLTLFSLLADFSTDRIADLDMLTQLPNRRHAMTLLEMEVQRLGRSSGFCLALGDVDRFKNINDTHGHSIGDDVLRYISQALSSNLRKGDWAARWGGEEFLIYIKGDDLATGLQPLERIKHALNAESFAGPPVIPVTMSFGVVSTAGQPEHLQTLVDKADGLMYESKKNGRNRITWEDTEGGVWGASRITQAVARGSIVPSYTPVYDWTGYTIAARVTVGLAANEIANEDEDEQVTRLLSSAETLQLRAEVDWAMLTNLRAQLAEGAATVQTPLFVSLSNALLNSRWDELMALFAQYPFIHLGLYAHEELSEDNTNKIIHSRLPIALIDFNHNSPIPTPVHYLRYDIRHIVFTSVDANTQTILNILPRTVKCYCPKVREHTAPQLHALGFSGTINEADRQQTLGFLQA